MDCVLPLLKLMMSELRRMEGSKKEQLRRRRNAKSAPPPPLPAPPPPSLLLAHSASTRWGDIFLYGKLR